MNWFKHAFAIDATEQLKPNDAQRALIERLCGEVVRRRMTAPAVFLLEMSQPLNYVGSQFLRFVQPIVTTIADADSYQELTNFLEHRGSLEYLCKRLESLEADYALRHRSRRSKPVAPSTSIPSEPHGKS